ncbi:MAG TPA: CDP-diacylglycerol--serine O-phosphatidyltransferase [Bdellovibrionota bacterium]|nr:CDP-diacylglycerol--serine O-phosphatidyltransferase [Bdellovibrionota bacterium]
MSDLSQGVYMLPNLFTTASLMCGFYAVINAINLGLAGRQDFSECAWAILLAAMFDGLDGRVARRTRTASRFGTEYDSLSDLVSFGVAPAVVLHIWALGSMGRIGWLGSFLYLACGALRLARFNVQSGSVEKKFFQGLPIPMAAMMVSAAILIWEGKLKGDTTLFFEDDVYVYLLVMTFSLAGLMVSSIPYRSFKTLHLTDRRPFYSLVLVVMGLMIWVTKPWWMLFFLGCAYLLSGPIEQYVLPRPVRAFERAKRRHRVRKALDRLDSLASGPLPTPPGTKSEDEATGENVRPLRRS